LNVENSVLGSLSVTGTGPIDSAITFSSIANGVQAATGVPSGVKLAFDIIANVGSSSDSVVCAAPCQLQFSSNVIFPQAGAVGSGTISSDPLFVAPPGDLHLRAGSPAIDVVPVSSAPPTDLDGTARPVGPKADVGAYEFH
jgi:hypothetical protein